MQWRETHNQNNAEAGGKAHFPESDSLDNPDSRGFKRLRKFSVFHFTLSGLASMNLFQESPPFPAEGIGETDS